MNHKKTFASKAPTALGNSPVQPVEQFVKCACCEKFVPEGMILNHTIKCREAYSEYVASKMNGELDD